MVKVWILTASGMVLDAGAGAGIAGLPTWYRLGLCPIEERELAGRRPQPHLQKGLT